MTEQDQLGPSQDGTVMLDIGGDIGALVLHAPPEMVGVEIEISPHGHNERRSHVAIRERRGNGRTRYAAIYPTLPAGTYTLWTPHGPPAAHVHITGGTITETHWPTTTPPAGQPPLTDDTHHHQQTQRAAQPARQDVIAQGGAPLSSEGDVQT